jgi:hypothetical protein
MRESTIESYLVAQCKKHGAWAEKHVSPGYKGAPDRFCHWPFAKTDQIETKSTTGRVKKHQERDHERRAALGHKVWIIRSKAEVDGYIRFALWRHAEAERRENGL